MLHWDFFDSAHELQSGPIWPTCITGNEPRNKWMSKNKIPIQSKPFLLVGCVSNNDFNKTKDHLCIFYKWNIFAQVKHRGYFELLPLTYAEVFSCMPSTPRAGSSHFQSRYIVMHACIVYKHESRIGKVEQPKIGNNKAARSTITAFINSWSYTESNTATWESDYLLYAPCTRNRNIKFLRL